MHFVVCLQVARAYGIHRRRGWQTIVSAVSRPKTFLREAATRARPSDSMQQHTSRRSRAQDTQVRSLDNIKLLSLICKCVYIALLHDKERISLDSHKSPPNCRIDSMEPASRTHCLQFHSKFVAPSCTCNGLTSIQFSAQCL